MRIPVQAEALCLVSDELDLGVDLAKVGWLKGVFCPVKDQDPTIHAESGNDVWVLRLVSRLIHLPGVLDLVNNVALDGCDIPRFAVATNLSPLFIKFIRIGRHRFGDLDVGDLKEIGAVVGGVGAEQEPVGAEILTLHVLDIREPLDSQGRPGKSLAAKHQKDHSNSMRRRCPYPKIISYKKGLFFFHVLYSRKPLAKVLGSPFTYGAIPSLMRRSPWSSSSSWVISTTKCQSSKLEVGLKLRLPSTSGSATGAGAMAGGLVEKLIGID